MKSFLCAALAAVLTLSASSPAFALGTASYSSELISTRSLGQGGTGVAGVHEDPIASFTNPAALSYLKGTQAAVGVSYANSRPTFTSGVTSPGGLASNYTAANQGDVTGARATEGVVPNFGASTQLGDSGFTAGLAVVVPFGLETHWNGDSPMRYQATDARLRVVDVAPSLAYKLNDQLTFGAGFDYYDTVEAQLDHKINMPVLNLSLAGAPVGADGSSRLNGNGDGWGFHLGATWRPNEHHQFGVAYHSLVKMNLVGNTQLNGLAGNAAAVFGGSDFSAHAEAPLYIPQNVQFGYAWMPTDKWQIEADAAWWDFGQARELAIDYSKAGLTAAQSAVLNNPASNPTRFNPRDTINFGAGVNHRCTDRLQARAGFFYQAASLPERFFDAAFVDLPRYAATLGAGWKATDSLSVDLAYNAIFFHGRSVDAPSAGGSGYKGNFNNFGNVVSAALTWRTAAHL